MTRARTPNVILIVFDTLRYDAVSAYGQKLPWGDDFPAISTPNFDRFAAQSVRFDRAFPETLPTIPARRSFYTGKRVYPFRDDAVDIIGGDFKGSPGWIPIPDHDDTLAEIFKAHGYRTGLISDLYHQFKPSMNFTRGFDEWSFLRGQETDNYRSGPKLSMEEILRYVPREFLELRDAADSKAGLLRQPLTAEQFARRIGQNVQDRERDEDWFAARVLTDAVRWLRQNADAKDQEGVFLTIESFDPHEPWFCPPEYRIPFDDSDGQENVISLYAELPEPNPALVRRTRANYAGVVTMTDKWFGVLLDELESGGWLDDSIVVVASDHGHSLVERGYMGKRGYPAEPWTVRVPLLVRFPGVEPKVTDAWAQHHDIAATLLDAAGVKPFQPIDGQSLLPHLLEGTPGPRDHVVVAYGAGLCIVTDEWWLSVKADGTGAILHAWADDLWDPDAPNHAEANPEVVDRLFQLALDAAGGELPAPLIKMAGNVENAPGCSPFAAIPLAGG